MARTSLGPFKFVPDTGSSNLRGLIIVPGQKANRDSLKKYFRSVLNNDMWSKLI